jgi:hypothetical protein
LKISRKLSNSAIAAHLTSLLIDSWASGLLQTQSQLLSANKTEFVYDFLYTQTSLG